MSTTTTTTTTTTRVRLWGWDDDFNAGRESTLALLFAEMVKIATPIMERFQGDLFHDAVWLNTHVNEPGFTFCWSVRTCGTTIGEPCEDFDIANRALGAERTFTIRVLLEDGLRVAEITEHHA